VKLYHGDCLEILKGIEDESIDLVLADPPYQVTGCIGDVIIPIDEMWIELKRIIKNKGSILLFGNEPFSSFLRTSNRKWFKYDWIWKKNNPSNYLQAKQRPLGIYENVSVFTKNSGNYYPQDLIEINKVVNYPDKTCARMFDSTNKNRIELIQKYTNYPRNVLKFKKEKGFHPNQKPIALLEYLIKTYTVENETVLDFTMGSGSTGVACLNTNRKFIGIEIVEKYFNIAKARIAAAGNKEV